MQRVEICWELDPTQENSQKGSKDKNNASDGPIEVDGNKMYHCKQLDKSNLEAPIIVGPLLPGYYVATAKITIAVDSEIRTEKSSTQPFEMKSMEQTLAKRPTGPADFQFRPLFNNTVRFIFLLFFITAFGSTVFIKILFSFLKIPFSKCGSCSN